MFIMDENKTILLNMYCNIPEKRILSILTAIFLLQKLWNLEASEKNWYQNDVVDFTEFV